MAELIVIHNEQQERLLFEGGGSTGAGVSPSNVAVSDWFKDKFWGSGVDGDKGHPGDPEHISKTIRMVGDAVVDGFRGMATDKADGGSFAGAEVEFGVTVSAEGNVYVTKAALEANLKVKFIWDFSE